MSQDISKVVDALSLKIQNLIEKFDFLQVENKVLRQQLQEIEQSVHQKQQLLTQQERELHTLRVAKTIQGSEYSKETTKKINTLIKEIDWCIEQLTD